MASDSSVAEEQYLNWKGWAAEKFGAPLRPRDRRYYDVELKRTGLPMEKPLDVLEIGFGNGGFLYYAQNRGWHVVGTETNRYLVDVATQNRFEAVCTENLSTFADGSFDLIVAFDVIEHIPSTSIVGFLQEARRVLRKGGVLLARFPNGDSPFGLVSQHGDITHVSVIGHGKAAYFAKAMGASVVFVGGLAQPIPAGEVLWTVYRLIAVPLRKLINFLIRLIFHPTCRADMTSTELVMILRVD